MPFPPSVRDQALVACARHCCVCHRYSGVGIEVHHIEQEAVSHDNSFENAIPLCFDCHAAAGHYNPLHPKGTRFSPSELRKARDQLFGLVREGKLNTAGLSTQMVRYRYLLSANADAIADILSCQHDSLPFGKYSLMANREGDEMAKAFSSSPVRKEVPFNSEEELRTVRPEFDGKFERTITLEDFSDGRLSYPLFEALIERGVEPGRLGKAYIQNHECGDSYWSEDFVFRRLFGLFLEVLNVSTEYVSFVSLQTSGGWSSATLELAPCLIPPAGSLIIPMGTILGPFEDDPIHGTRVQDDKNLGDRGQSLQLITDDWNSVEPVAAFFLPTAAIFQTEEGEIDLPLHDPFSRSGLYHLDRFWMCGSCPHLYVRFRATNEWIHVGELFTKGDPLGSSSLSQFNLHTTAVELAIIEPDFETSFVEFVEVDGIILGGPRYLSQGNVMTLADPAGFTNVRICGWYRAPIMRPTCLDQRLQQKRQLKTAAKQLGVL